MTRSRFHATTLALCMALAGLVPASPAAAQAVAPSAEQMIEQLKLPPRTRGLRNLSVEAAPAAGVGAQSPAAGDAAPAQGAAAAAAAAAPRPSLSLLIQFDFNSARVRPESQQALANLSQALQSAELADSRFAIEGHTDAKGREDYNRKLSEQRAQAVAEFLAARGVKAARLAPVGKGASELANTADPYAAENRRVRIVNLD